MIVKKLASGLSVEDFDEHVIYTVPANTKAIIQHITIRCPLDVILKVDDTLFRHIHRYGAYGSEDFDVAIFSGAIVLPAGTEFSLQVVDNSGDPVSAHYTITGIEVPE